MAKNRSGIRINFARLFYSLPIARKLLLATLAGIALGVMELIGAIRHGQVGDVFEVCRSEHAQVGAFGEVLTQQTIGVFVAAEISGDGRRNLRGARSGTRTGTRCRT